MMDRIAALLAYALLLAFLGILVWKVPQLDLGLVVLATLALAGADMLQVVRKHDKDEQTKGRGES